MVTRVGLIVDVNSLYQAAKEKLEGVVSYQALLENLVGNRYDRKLVEAVAVFDTTAKIRTAFVRALEAMSFVINHDSRRAAEDRFAHSMMRLAPAVDTLILVTGSQIYLSIMDFLSETDRDLGLEVAFFHDKTDNELLENADRFVELDSSYVYDADVPERAVGRRSLRS